VHPSLYISQHASSPTVVASSLAGVAATAAAQKKAAAAPPPPTEARRVHLWNIPYIIALFSHYKH
jgi:hypothetical protein